MRIIGFGELEANFYFKNKIFEGINNGNEISLILANLSNTFNTSFYGVVGKDLLGNKLLNELCSIGMDISNVLELKKNTVKRFIDNNKTTIYCPFCDRVNTSIYDDYVFNDEVDSDDIFIVNKLDKDFCDKYKNKKYLYLNNTDYVLDFDLDDIKYFKDMFEIIYLSKEVYLYLKEKFLIDSYDLYEILSPKLLFIFKDKTGIDIIYNNEFIKKENLNYKEPLDISGSKEILFSEFIKNILEYKELNELIISKCFIKSLTLYNYVANHLGSLINIKGPIKSIDYNECICKNIIDK